MKVTALLLFVILLIVLVISVIIANRSGSSWKEGFVSYQNSVAAGQTFTLPTYSSNSNVTKLFDNLFYDQANGNLIEIDSPQFTVGGVIDLAGIGIISTTVTTRDNNTASNQYKGNVTILPGGQTSSVSVPESKLGSVSINYNSYIYKSLSSHTNVYCAFYIPWYKDTYIHILDLTTNSHVGTYAHSNGQFYSKQYSVDANKVPNSAIGLKQITNNYDKAMDSFISLPLYDAKKMLYEISKYVKYDITNGNLIVLTDSGITVYGRTNPITTSSYNKPGMVSNSATAIASLPFSPNLINDTLGNNVILYIPNGTNTLVAIISLKNTAIPGVQTANYTLTNVVRFTATGVDNGSNMGSKNGIMGMFNNYLNGMGNSMPQYGGIPQYGGMPPGGTNPYWPSAGTNKGGCPMNGGYTDDYLLKTQIVPPVCPSCPSCGNGNGVCTNCGGSGGSGTKTTNGKTMVSGEKGQQTMYQNLTDESSFFGEGTTSTGKKDANGNDIAWKSDIGKGTFSSNADPNTLAGGFVLSQYSMIAGLEEGAYTAADVAKTGIGAVGGAVKDVTGTVGGVANNAINGVTGLAKNNQGTTTGGATGGATTGGATGGATGDSASFGGSRGLGDSGNLGGGIGSVGAAGSAGSVGAGGSAGSVGAAGASGSGGLSGTGGPGTGSGSISYSGPQSMDQYSYYGALPAKAASNYMPVTADFSSFRH
jgi:hypothetical protein